MLAKLGRFLLNRFPERVVVTPEMYATLVERIINLETNSVHKDAVKTLVVAVKDVKDEFATIRTGLGLNSPRVAELMAVLNGQPISQGDDNA